MATVLRYNDVQLHNVLIREFRQEVVYDTSGVNRLMSRYTISVEGVVAAGYARAYLLQQRSPQELIRAVQLALAEPRRSLTITQYSWGREQEELLFRCVPSSAYATDPDRDLGAGPKPTDLRIISVLGAQTYQVQWTVVCEKLEKPAPGLDRYLDGYQGPQPVLSNRWGISEEFDSNLYCTRTIAGSLRMSLPAAQTGLDFRWLCVPGLEPGFRRERMRYAVQPDGLEVQYEIQDRQYHTMPPWPATDMSVRHTRETNYGITAIARCEVQLSGPPDVPRPALLSRLVQILDYYLGILRNADEHGKSWQVRQASITEEIGPHNQISGNIEIQILGDPSYKQSGSADFLTQHLLSVGRDLRLDDQPTPEVPGRSPPGQYHPCIAEQPSPYGYTTWGGQRSPAVTAVLQCYLQQPYRPPHGIGNWHIRAAEPEKQQSYPTRVERVTPEALRPPGKDQYSESHKQNLYTYARMRNRYLIDRMVVGCPIAGQSVDSKSPSVGIVRLAQPSAVRSVRYDAERLGAWPEIPAPEDFDFGGGDGGVKAVLQRFAVRPLPPVVGPTGEGLVYRIQAYYRWLLDRAPQMDKPWPIGRLPHVEDRDRAEFRVQSIVQARLGPSDDGG